MFLSDIKSTLSTMLQERPAPQSRRLEEDLKKRFKRADLLKLNPLQVAARARSTGKLSLAAGGDSFDLELTPNDLRSPNYRAEEVADGGLNRAVDVGALRTYKGTVRGMANAQARFTIDERKLEGMIATPDTRYYLEPASRYSNSADPSDFVFYSSPDVLQDSEGECGTTLSSMVESRAEKIRTDKSLLTSNQTDAASASSTFSIRAVEVATEADFEYVNFLGGSANADNEILSIMNQVDGIFNAELGISFTIVYQHSWATDQDPYTLDTMTGTLNQFRQYWLNNKQDIQRDLAHMWTARTITDGFAGMAYVGVLCSQPQQGYAVSYLRTWRASSLAAHEFGHNFGASHIDNIAGCGETLMNSGVGFSTTFCQYSRDQINNFISNNSSCLSSTQTSCTYSLSSDNQSFDATGGAGSVSVTASSGCSWLATSNVNWINIDGFGDPMGLQPFSATGSSNVGYTVSVNMTGAPRTGTITAAGFTFTVNQSAAFPTPTPTPTPYPLSGRVTDISGNGISTVTLTVTGATNGQTLSAQTDAQGNYSFNNSIGGDTLTPSKAGYLFSPSAVRSVSSSGVAPITGTYNFVGGTNAYTINGQVIDGTGAGLSNVLMTVSGSMQTSVLTDAEGRYSLSSLFAGGNYTVTPSRSGYVFNPPKATFNNLSSNRTLTFVGTTHPYTISGQIKDASNNALSNVAVTLSRAGGVDLIVSLTDAGGSYGFVNVAPEATYTVTPSKSGFIFKPPSATFSNPSGNQTANFTAAVTPALQFSQSNYSYGEADPLGYATITVTRTGDTSGTVTTDYATSDQSGMTPCQISGNGIASERCDYATSAGTLRFAAGETQKTIQIPLINDAHQEPDENFTISLRNPQGAVLGTATATVTIKDDDTQPATRNPIDDQAFFIKEQYIDFLGRVAEPAGFDFWMNRMTNCPQGQVCDRIDTSQRFFQSDEFQERGFYVYRLYDEILGRLPKYAEFVPDVARLNGFQSAAEQRLEKDAYLADFMQKAEFKSIYGQYLWADMKAATNAQGFVDALCQTAGVTVARRAGLINDLQTGARTPAQILEDFILQPELSAVGTKFYDRGFITMQYFGYLRRDPEIAGFDFWQNQLIGPNAVHKQDYRFMVGGFLQSDEYRYRFAPPSSAP